MQNKLERHGSLYVRHIETDICKLPGGMLWWSSLPEKGKRSPKALRRRWSDQGYNLGMSKELNVAMLRACLGNGGMVSEQSKELYYWMKEWLYSEDDTRMYSEWFKVSGG